MPTPIQATSAAIGQTRPPDPPRTTWPVVVHADAKDAPHFGHVRRMRHGRRLVLSRRKADAAPLLRSRVRALSQPHDPHASSPESIPTATAQIVDDELRLRCGPPDVLVVTLAPIPMGDVHSDPA